MLQEENEDAIGQEEGSEGSHLNGANFEERKHVREHEK